MKNIRDTKIKYFIKPYSIAKFNKLMQNTIII